MIFMALMAVFQIRLNWSGECQFQPRRAGRGRWLELSPETATRSKQGKNNPGRLRTYVTYDTLMEGDILLRVI
jgi:hypothetical protein